MRLSDDEERRMMRRIRPRRAQISRQSCSDIESSSVPTTINKHHSPEIGAYSPVFIAPSTFPMMLYRLLKNVNQSFSTFLCSSERSDHSGRHSAVLVNIYFISTTLEQRRLGEGNRLVEWHAYPQPSSSTAPTPLTRLCQRRLCTSLRARRTCCR